MTSARTLTGKQRRKLRALGHHLAPVVHVGQQGVTAALVAATHQALEDHELIKVKVGDAPVDRHEAAEQLAQATQAEVAQVLGRTVLLFRKREKDSKIDV
jgi:RNA-binding protein